MLCCALAERGHRVTGVDPAATMLAVARRKPHAEQVEWVESSAQTYRAHRRFDLIVVTGHAFQILLTDADALAVFETARGHLKQRGRVAFETRNPRVDWCRSNDPSHNASDSRSHLSEAGRELDRAVERFMYLKEDKL